ncbi:hypothetical protein VPH35_090026 [Triticum aestivum]
MTFTDEYKGNNTVEAHDNTKLHVIHTNDKKQMAITLVQYERHLNLQCHNIIGIDLEYDNNPEATQKPALCQLSIGKNHPVLLFQMSDTERLERVKLEVANFVDIQKEWRVPEATKPLNSLGDIFGVIIDDYYNNMKKKITDDEHQRWATLPLSRRHIEYAAKDAYAAYEIWNRITLTQDGLNRAKLEKEEPPKKRARSSWAWGEPD